MPTMMEVVVELLCTATVASTPSMTPTTGFCRISVWAKTRPVLRPLSRRKAEARRSREQMNRYSRRRTATIRNKI